MPNLGPSDEVLLTLNVLGDPEPGNGKIFRKSGIRLVTALFVIFRVFKHALQKEARP